MTKLNGCRSWLADQIVALEVAGSNPAPCEVNGRRLLKNGELVFQEYSVNAETMVCLIQNLLILMVILE